MYSITAAEAPASDQIWWGFLALRAIDDAADAVADAESVGMRLALDSAWQNDGTSARKMREALDGLHTAIMQELAAVRALGEQLRRALDL
ncbi:hypothetical protein [Microbacterium sp. YJN-G]|uniref:hypothetical protein n=1 Tax=Microbacterium sp. YJN-G TaxID=2763257 RepID=UPI0018787067|nr:hypothetical protein [Microbacterium sp. YJN-G]